MILKLVRGGWYHFTDYAVIGFLVQNKLKQSSCSYAIAQNVEVQWEFNIL